jgi:hypothetical protein
MNSGKSSVKKRIKLIILLISIITIAICIQPVIASGTIYIRSGGRVDPPTAPIQRDGDLYIFTDNIYDGIVVERDNIVVDGANHTVTSPTPIMVVMWVFPVKVYVQKFC